MIAWPEGLSVFIIPPLLSVVTGLSLAFLSLMRGRGLRENLLFALVCVLWSTIPGSYVLHYLLVDAGPVLRSDRIMTAVYRFLPFANIVLFHHILRVRYRVVEFAALGFSTVFSMLTFHECFYSELLYYSWGVIASGGPCFEGFALYSAAGTVYGLILVGIHLRGQENQLRRLKIQYIFLSLITGALLNLMNVLPLKGVDLFPPGNFTFVPMGIMAYGILRHRLVEVESLLSLTFMWILTSLLIAIPNGLALLWFRDYLSQLNTMEILLIGTAWFYLNFLSVRKVQPVIDQLFHRHVQDLHRAENRLVNQILLLKSIATMRDEFTSVVKQALILSSADLFVLENGKFRGSENNVINIEEKLKDWFLGADHLSDRNMVETNPYYSQVRPELLSLFDRTNSNYLVPLMQNGILSGLMTLGSKLNGKVIHADEVAFINNVKTAGAIALSNALLYQDLHELKVHLEGLVADRTRKLQLRNDQMVFELRLARVVQRTILTAAVADHTGIEVVARVIPMMEVSGDFYHAVNLAGNRYGIGIVDVSGHGMPAALLTSMIKTEIDNQFIDGRSTAEVCSALGTALSPTLSESGLYFTIFLAIIDLDSQHLQYTGCGHVAPVLLRSSGELLTLESDGVVVGSALRGLYVNHTVDFLQGDQLYLYTDGLIDAIDEAGDCFGEERFYELIHSCADQSAVDQLELILGTVTEHRKHGNAERSDDITLMIVALKATDGQKNISMLFKNEAEGHSDPAVKG